MVGTRPTNRLGKIPDGTFIDLSPEKQPKKKKARRKIVMEDKQTPEKKSTEESPTALDGALLENFAAGADAAPTLEDVLKEGREETDPPQTEESPTVTKGEPSSKGKKKKRETPTASSTKNTPAGSSRTESAKTETKEEEDPEKEVSDEESSGDAGDNEEEKEDKEDEEEAEDDEEEVEEEEEDDEEKGDEDVKLLREEGPPAKRARVQTRSSRKGKAPMVSTEEMVSNKEVVVPKKLDLKLLSDLGIKEEVEKLFDGIGWGRFLKWDTDVYEELVREFYGSLEIEHAKTVPLGIKFNLLGEQRKVKINELDLSLKMVSLLDLTSKGYQEAVTSLPNYSDKKWSAIWAELAKLEEFKSCENKGTSLKAPAMRMCHRIISYNLYGKKDSSNSVSKSELFILWAMHKKIRLNFAAFAVSHMRSILGRKEQRLSLAHLPTVFARENDLLDPELAMTKERGETFDLKTLKKMLHVREGKKGKLIMLDEPEKSTAKPARPSTSSRARHSATPELAQDDTPAALAKLQETVDEIQSALRAYFAHQGFRYPPESP